MLGFIFSCNLRFGVLSSERVGKSIIMVGAEHGFGLDDTITGFKKMGYNGTASTVIMPTGKNRRCDKAFKIMAYSKRRTKANRWSNKNRKVTKWKNK